MNSFLVGKGFPLALFILKRINGDYPNGCLTHVELLCIVGYGSASDLAHQLSHGMGGKFKLSYHRKLMMVIQRRIASNLIIALRNKVAKKAEELCALGQFAAAVVPMQFAIALGDLPSLALKAWLLIYGREGVAKDKKRGFELAEEGARLGCHHCQGVVAYCYMWGYGCQADAAQSLELARESSGRGSRYGQYALGELHRYGREGLARDVAQGIGFYRLAAAQGFDGAQFQLGYMYYHGSGVAQDDAEALRLFQLAAAQGHPRALFYVADCHEQGHGVAADVAEAIRWHRRAQAAENT